MDGMEIERRRRGRPVVLVDHSKRMNMSAQWIIVVDEVTRKTYPKESVLSTSTW